MSAPQLCKNECVEVGYTSTRTLLAGHPAADKWLPLEYNHDRNVRTGLIHNCPKRPRTQPQQQHHHQQQQPQQPQDSASRINSATQTQQPQQPQEKQLSEIQEILSRMQTEKINRLQNTISLVAKMVYVMLEKQDRQQENFESDRNLLNSS